MRMLLTFFFKTQLQLFLRWGSCRRVFRTLLGHLSASEGISAGTISVLLCLLLRNLSRFHLRFIFRLLDGNLIKERDFTCFFFVWGCFYNASQKCSRPGRYSTKGINGLTFSDLLKDLYPFREGCPLLSPYPCGRLEKMTTFVHHYLPVLTLQTYLKYFIHILKPYSPTYFLRHDFQT